MDYANTPSGFDEKNNGIEYGIITEREYHSDTTDAIRKCFVITPAGYDKNVKYPVLYLLHGIGGIHTEWLYGNPVEVMGNLTAKGEVKPMVVVIPNIRASKDDSVPQEVISKGNIDACDNFINDLKNDLMPFIKNNYSISEKRSETAIAGLSMGGRESLYIGVSMPETFGYIGAFSPAPGLLPAEKNLPTGNILHPGQLTPDKLTLPKEYKGNMYILICTGLQDMMVYDVAGEYHKTLEKNGVPHTYYMIDGGHDFHVWKNGLYHFAKAIF